MPSPPYDNPFERFGIDPREGPRAITERMRDLLEEARSETERAELRAAWEELTLHPAARLRAALRAHPASGDPRDATPPAQAPPPIEPLGELTLYELSLRPEVAQVLDASRVGGDRATNDALDHDPVLARPMDRRAPTPPRG